MVVARREHMSGAMKFGSLLWHSLPSSASYSASPQQFPFLGERIFNLCLQEACVPPMPLLSLLVILLLLRRLLVLRVRIRIIVICATNTSTGHHRRHHYYLHYLQFYRCRRCKQHLYLKLRLRKGRQLWHNARLSQEEVLNLHGSQRLLRLTWLNSRACRSQYGIMPTDILKRVHFRLF